jgi:PAS domain-containing protein
VPLRRCLKHFFLARRIRSARFAVPFRARRWSTWLKPRGTILGLRRMNNPKTPGLSRALSPGERDPSFNDAAKPAAQPPEESDADARQAVRFLHAIFDQMPVALRLQAEGGKTLLANAMAVELSGDGGDAVDQEPPPVPGVGSDGNDDQEAAATNKPATITAEDRAVGPRGERTVLEIRKPVSIASRSFVLSASFDITERKQVERAVKARLFR